MAKTRLQRIGEAAAAWEQRRRSWLPTHLAPKRIDPAGWEVLYALRVEALPVSKHTVEGVHVAQAQVDQLARRGLVGTYRQGTGRMAALTPEGRVRVAKVVLPPSLRAEGRHRESA